MSSSRILVAGATGFLGRALIASFAARKMQVTAFMRDTSIEGFIPPGISMIKGDLKKIAPLRSMLERFDVVIHCAAAMEFAPKNVQSLYETNVDGTANLVRAAASAGVRQFIYISSTETTAPTIGEEPADETTEPDAIFEYGKTKILAEQEVNNATQNVPMNYTIIRPTGILGANDTATAYQLFWAIDCGLFFFVPGSAKLPPRRVCYTHVTDIVKGISLVIDNPKAYGQTYILSSNSMSYEALIRHAAHHLGRIQPFMYLPFGLVRAVVQVVSPLTTLIFPQKFLFQAIMIDQLQRNRVYSSEKAKRELGWTPAYSMEDAIADTIHVQQNTGLLKTYILSPVALVCLGIVILILLRLLFGELF